MDASMYFILCDMQAGNPFTVAMRALPLLYGTSVGIVLSLVLIKAQPTHAWPLWLTAVVTLAVAVAIAVAVQLLLVPQLRHKVHSWEQDRASAASSPAGPHPKLLAL